MSPTTTPGPRKDPWATVGKLVVGFVGIVLLVVITSILRGLVLAQLWEWFIVPLGLRSINVAEAIGLALIVGMLTQATTNADDTTDKRPRSERFLGAFFASVFYAGFALLIGWVVQLFL